MDPFHPQARDDRPERPELFISYASPDLDRAAALHTRLAAEGFRVWFDNVRLNPGCDWDAPLLRGTGSDQITDDDEAGGDADPHEATAISPSFTVAGASWQSVIPSLPIM